MSFKTNRKRTLHSGEGTLANDNQSFSLEQCRALFADVLVHDDYYSEASLPDKIHLNYSQQQLSDCYQICFQLWTLDIRRRPLSGIVRKISRTGSLDPNDKDGFRFIRANFKHLRFACKTFARGHRVPFLFHGFVALMGRLQDTLKNSKGFGVFYFAYLLRFFLGKWPYSLVVKKLDRFEPTTGEAFRMFIMGEVELIRKALVSQKITGKAFHRVRIVISRQVALYDNLKNLYPSNYHKSISEYLSTLNGMMGELHDELVTKKYNKIQDYHKDLFEIPDNIRQKLIPLTQRYQFYS